MKRIVALLIVSLATPSASLSADTYPRDPRVDILHYTFRLTLNDQSDEIDAEAIIDARFLAAGVTELVVDLVGKGAGDKGMTVSDATSGGQPVRFVHEGHRLKLALPAASTVNQRTQFTVRYRGLAAAGLETGKNRHGDRTFFSDNWPDKARHWLPMVDHIADKASSEFIVTAPAHYQVVSNGLLQEETDLANGLRRTHWKQSVPISAWLNALGVARFAVQHDGFYDGKAVQTWVYPQDRDAGFHDFQLFAKPVLEFFGSHIGPYAYEKLANVQTNAINGGMELASAIFYGERSVTGKGTMGGLIAHEIAHQWFGDAVTESDWDHVWLSEGFATYFTLLFTEHSRGRDAFVEGLQRSRRTVIEFDRKTPNYRVVHDNLSDMSKVLTGQIYQKGGWTLHMLRGVIGTDHFWTGIREYYRRYRDGNASTDDFRRVMEEVSGTSLDGFFRQWLYRGGYPVFEGGWRYDAQAKTVQVELNQTQPGDPFRMPVQIGITTKGQRDPRIETVQVADRSHTFTIKVDVEPETVLLDPNTWLLHEGGLAKR